MKPNKKPTLYDWLKYKLSQMKQPIEFTPKFTYMGEKPNTTHRKY